MIFLIINKISCNKVKVSTGVQPPELEKMEKKSVFLDKFRINSGIFSVASLGLKPLRLPRARNSLAGWQFLNGL